MLKARLVAGSVALTLATTTPIITRPALAASAAEINRDANKVLGILYERRSKISKIDK